MDTIYFRATTMHLVERGNGAQSMGAEKYLDMIGFRENFRDDPRAACASPTAVEKAVITLRDQGKPDAMVSMSRELNGRVVQIQCSLWDNYTSFEWAVYEY